MFLSDHSLNWTVAITEAEYFLVILPFAAFDIYGKCVKSHNLASIFM